MWIAFYSIFYFISPHNPQTNSPANSAQLGKYFFPVRKKMDQRIFQVGNPIMYQAYCVASLNMKNLISPTPLNCARNAFTLALNDSADAFVRRLSK